MRLEKNKPQVHVGKAEEATKRVDLDGCCCLRESKLNNEGDKYGNEAESERSALNSLGEY